MTSNDETCRYCGAAHCERQYSLPWHDERFSKYGIMYCNQCSMGFVTPLPTEEQLKLLYDSLNYHDSERLAGNLWQFEPSQLNALIQSEWGFIDPYKQFLPRSGRVLDVGAGWGTLLKSFHEHGYTTVGVEISDTTSQFARERLGLDIYNLPIERIGELPNQPLDLVTMRHVLEHFYSPRDVLQNLHSRLVIGGKMIIVVPDYGSYDRRAYGDDWPGFGPYHLWYFSQPSLERLLQDTGFRPLSFHRFLSERILPGSSRASKLGRKLLRRLGFINVFSGRSIGLIAEKI